MLVVLFFVHVSQGQADIDVPTVWESLVHPSSDTLEHQIVRFLRLPRAVVGILAGAALGIAGVLLQSVTRNPLASPTTLGINAGAYLAVVAAAIYTPGLLTTFPIAVALIGGTGTALIAFAIAGAVGLTPVRLTLAGITVSMAVSAITGALQLFYENETTGLFLWGAGSLIQNDWSGIAYAWIPLAVAAAAALALSNSLDALELGDDVARGLGQKVGLVRTVSLLVAVFLAAVTVSVVGPIGFVGLIVPHLVRLAGVRRHWQLLLGSALWGPIVLVGADVAVRSIAGTAEELPAGAVTALIGAPWLIWLVRRWNTSGSSARDAAAGGGSRTFARSRVGFAFLLLGAITLAGAIVGVSTFYGVTTITPADVVGVMTGNGDGIAQLVVAELRLPRALVAAVVGAALGVSGLLLQGVIRNPLADPSIIGVTSGAAVGALAAIVIWPHLSAQVVPPAALAGAMLAVAVTLFFSWGQRVDPERIALIGIAVSSLGSAVIQILVIKADFGVATALAWLSGSTYGRGWSELAGLAPWVFALIPLSWFAARSINPLGLGDAVATGLGVQVRTTRLLAVAVSVGLAAAAVSTVGTIGFVGLIAPHMSRLLAGHDHRRLVPLVALVGAVLLVSADFIGRTVAAPREIPSGLLVTILGAPYFLWLLYRTRRSG